MSSLMTVSNETPTFLTKWTPYLNTSDIEKIRVFAENTKNGIRHEKALVFYGTGNNGKTTLIRDIERYVAEGKFQLVARTNFDENRWCQVPWLKELMSYKKDMNFLLEVQKLPVEDRSIMARFDVITFEQSF